MREQVKIYDGMRRILGGAAVLAILTVMVVMGKRNTSVGRYLGKEAVEMGEPFSLEYSMEFRPTPKMTAWLIEHDIDVEFGFEDSLPMVEFPDSRTARLFDREFGVFMPEGKTQQPKV